MFKPKILCLGNEFIKEDSLAKQVGENLKEDFEIVNIKDGFELINYLNSDNLIILDVVENLTQSRILSINNLKTSKIITAHDFDAGFFLQLLGNKNIKIIGIPQKGNLEIIKKEIKKLLKP